MPTGERLLSGSALLLTALAAPCLAQSGQGGAINLQQLDDPVKLEAQLRALPREGAISITNGQVHRGNFGIVAGQTIDGNLLVVHGNADVSGTVRGNVVTLDGDIVLHQGGVVAGDVLALGGAIRDLGGRIQGEQRALGRAAVPVRSGGVGAVLTKLAGFAAVALTLTLLGFGMVLFAQPQLETISDTVTHSLPRSFFTGLLAQLVVLPTLGMMITGLVLSVVGILLVPFVLVVVPLLVIAAAVTGFLAVAHAMGEQRVRRRAAAGGRVGSMNSYRYVITGLTSIGALWLGWILFGWVPLAGTLVFLAAFIATWLLATVGFGAALLSRGGIRPAFSGRYLPQEALTDEYLWATPRFGVTAAKRPPKEK